MISISAYSVPSCSGSGLRKRRNDSDSENSGLKISKGQFYFVLESESEIPSSEEDTESFLSLQNRSTDFCKDTSDTSSKVSRYGSDFEIEYEVASLSEHDQKQPFDSYSSGTDLDIFMKRKSEDEKARESGDSENGVLADNSSAPEDPPARDLISAHMRSCLKCRTPTPYVHYCPHCYKVRKDFFPPRPKRFKKKKISLKKKCPKPPQLLKDEKTDSCLESGSSQEIMLTQEEKPNFPCESEGLCNICLKNPKDGAFVHCRWVHIYSCYECSVKIWFSSKCCPLCNGKINKVLKVATG